MSKRQPKFVNIVAHWTGGGSYPNDIDLQSYHYLVDSDGKVHQGKYKPEDNLDCTDSNYCPHCGGGNTGRIGVALCGMHGYNNSMKFTKYPITQKQFEAMCNLIANLCIKYRLKPNQVITHSEFGKQFPNTSSKGKIDIDYLPYLSLFGTDLVANYIRNKVNWYMNKALTRNALSD